MREKILKNRHFRWWKSVVTALAGVVVFCTTYALILPAITMENQAYCGYEEHTHGEDCYTVELVCTLSNEPAEVHEHTESCYKEEEKLVCGMEEAAAHVHTIECQSVEKVIGCGQEESAGHTHSDSCYVVEKQLVCGLEENEEHTHLEECYIENSVPVCGQEESAGHTHSEECYVENMIYICGMEETAGHTHTEACYEASEVLVCDLETEADIEEHIHTEECYQRVFACEKEEHVHEKICYSDKTADVETAEDWEQTLPEELTGVWAEDLLAVAESQLEYKESTRNYIVADDGEIKGYSRYGAWDGNAYGDWCAMFVSFCLNYAEVDEELMPREAGCQKWIELLAEEEYGLYREAAAYEAVPGDLIFFDTEGDEGSDHVGIVVEVLEETEENSRQIRTIEGNTSDMVCYRTYEIDDESIIGYGALPEKPEEEAAGEDKVVDEDVTEQETSEIAMEEYTYANKKIVVSVAVPEGTVASESAELRVELVESEYEESECGEKLEKTESEGEDTEQSELSKTESENLEEIIESEIDEGNQRIIEQKTCRIGLFDNEEELALECENIQVTINYLTETKEPASLIRATLTDAGQEPEAILSEAEGVSGETVTLSFTAGKLSDYSITIEESSTQEMVPLESPMLFSAQPQMLMTLSEDGKLVAGEYGKFVLSYNETKDAFIRDSAYAKFYNEDSPLGTAGSFHVVGFDTVTLKTHTNGNVLAKNLYAGANFGTNNYPYELSYVQNYLQVNENSASKAEHMLVLGDSHEMKLVDNGNYPALVGEYGNEQKISRPANIVVDADTANAPFIDLARVEAEISGLSDKLAAKASTGVTKYQEQHNQSNCSFTLENPDDIGYYHMTASELASLPNELHMKGFESGHQGTIVMNIDCTGATSFTMPNAIIYVDGKEQSTNEVTEFSAGKVIWNFINADGVQIRTQRMTGMVIAPGATVEISQNLNGTVVAENVTVSAESHRTDFTGTLEEFEYDPGTLEDEDGPYIILYKVDSANINNHLAGATFKLEKWDGSTFQTVWDQEPVKDDGSLLILDRLVTDDGKTYKVALSYNVAYRLTELTAPNGYEIKAEPRIFYISNQDTNKYQMLLPSNIEVKEFSGYVMYFTNYEKETEEPEEPEVPEIKYTALTVKKQWLDKAGDMLETAPTDFISFKLMQNVCLEDPAAAQNALTPVKIREYQTESYHIYAASNWSMQITGLPLNGMEMINGTETQVFYTYYVVETQTEGYDVTYQGNADATEGNIVIINQAIEEEHYELPETGGPGTYVYTAGGILLLMVSALLYINQKNRRKGGIDSN